MDDELGDDMFIEAVCRGDRRAFDVLVTRCRSRVFAIVFAIVRDANDANEVLQEVFMHVYCCVDRFDRRSSFSTWLYRIATNMSISFLRRSARHRSAVSIDASDMESIESSVMLAPHFRTDPFRVMQCNEMSVRIQKALGDLSAGHLSIILMREVEGMSYDEIVLATGLPKGTVMSRLFHARRRLQRDLCCYR